MYTVNAKHHNLVRITLKHKINKITEIENTNTHTEQACQSNEFKSKVKTHCTDCNC